MKPRELPPPESTPRPRRSQKGYLPVYLLLLSIATLLGAVDATIPSHGRPPVVLPPPAAVEPAAAEPEPLPPPFRSPAVVPQAAPRVASRGALIFIIDDVGYNESQLAPFLRVPGPLTLSILPQLPFTRADYAAILAAGKIPMLHQPMEADRGPYPGPGTLSGSMSEGEVEDTLDRDLAGMNEIRWVNNHEGSKGTSDPRLVTYLLTDLKKDGIRFLDSRTSATSAVQGVATELGIPYYARNSGFLDNVAIGDEILRQIDAGLAVSSRQGFAVMIGHVWDPLLAGILMDLYPRLRAEGFRLQSIADLPADMENVRERSGN